MAFGTPCLYPGQGGAAYAQLAEMPGYPTLKEALIGALVAGKDFYDYFDGDPHTWWEGECAELTPDERVLLGDTLMHLERLRP